MHDAERQNRYEMESLDEFEVELSDLPPSSRSHYMLLQLHTLKNGLRAAHQALFASDESAGPQITSTGSQNDEDEVEISDLPPSTLSHYRLLRLITLKKRLLTLIQQFFAHGPDNPQEPRASQRTRGRRPTRARLGQVLTTFGICAALLILLLGNDPSLPNQLSTLVHPATTPTSAANSSIVYTSVQIVNVDSAGATPIDPRINTDSPGPLPTTCPQANTLHQFPPSYNAPSPGIGNGRLWIIGFTGPIAALSNLRHIPPSLQIQEGFQWAATLDLFIEQGYNENFTLQGEDQLSGVNLQFSDINMRVAGPLFSFGLQSLATQPLLIDDGPWDILPVNVYLPKAGCYFLELDWSNGSRMIYFAAGR